MLEAASADAIAARRNAHRANLARYARLLVTELTELERDYIHRRVREERLALETLARDDALSAGAMELGRKEHQGHAVGRASLPAS